MRKRESITHKFPDGNFALTRLGNFAFGYVKTKLCLCLSIPAPNVLQHIKPGQTNV